MYLISDTNVMKVFASKYIVCYIFCCDSFKHFRKCLYNMTDVNFPSSLKTVARVHKKD